MRGRSSLFRNLRAIGDQRRGKIRLCKIEKQNLKEKMI